MGKMKRLTHIDSDGRAQMVDVSAKPLSKRSAVAERKDSAPEGNARSDRKRSNRQRQCIRYRADCRNSGRQTNCPAHSSLPYLPLGQIKIDIVASRDGAEVKCAAQTIAQTGVEMEALVGVTVALLTIYDMCKAVDKQMTISDVHLFKKTKSAVAAGTMIAQSQE